MTCYVVTLTGSALNLGTAVHGANGRNPPLRKLDMQPRGSNGGPIYVHSAPDVSNVLYGVRLEAGTTGVPPAPWVAAEFLNGPVYLKNFWVLGVNGEFLHLYTVEF